MREKLGEWLVQAGLVGDEDVRSALAECAASGERLGGVLVRMHLATETQIAAALSRQLGLPYVDLRERIPEPAAVGLIPKAVALSQECIALTREAQLLTVAMAEPLRFGFAEELQRLTGCRIALAIAARGEILDAIHAAYADARQAGAVPLPADEPAAAGRRGADVSAAAIADLADQVVRSAIAGGASDIHVEPAEEGLSIRHRLDGVVHDAVMLPPEVRDALAERLKEMAGMDAAERRRPQEGRIRGRGPDGGDVDFRVAALPTLFGEKIVLRPLAPRERVPALETLGLSAMAYERVGRLLGCRHGLILVAGPQGSGRSTTLAAALALLEREKPSVATVEDPIEYRIAGIAQTQVDVRSGLTVARALHAILQQDPDVVMVGDIRDGETAQAAARAATGPLVLSALDGDDAPAAAARLVDWGVDPAEAASVLRGVVAQRLVRRLCVHCRRRRAPAADVLRTLTVSAAESRGIEFYEPGGCDQCAFTGYRGRVGVYEVLEVTGGFASLVAAHAPVDRLREAALAGGMVTLAEDALSKVKDGTTSAAELLRVVTHVRQPRPLCTGCGSAIASDFTVCPRCGTRLGGECLHCGRALQPGWTFCPYCARSVGAGGDALGKPQERPYGFGG